MRKTVRDIWVRREVLRHFISVLLTTSYRTKTLGFLWALLDPLFFMAVYYIVFGWLIRSRPLPFILHIYVGVIAFRFLNSSVSQSAGILRGQAGLIREIAFPKGTLPSAVVVTRLFDFAAGWLVAVIIGCAFHIYPNAYWLLLPLVMALQALFVIGLSFLTAYIGVFFADIENVLNFALRLWFYLSPVLYPIADIEEKSVGKPYLIQIFLLNPMTSFLEIYQALVMGDMTKTGFAGSHLPDPLYVERAAAAAVIMFLFGLWVFSRGEGQIGKYV